MEAKGVIGGASIAIAVGNIAEQAVDAYVVPQLADCASLHGVGIDIARCQAKQGMDLYQEFLSTQGQPKLGTVVLTRSGGGKAKHLLHVVVEGGAPCDEYTTVQTTFYNALRLAERNGIESIAAPPLAADLLGELFAGDSARAMMAAISQYRSEDRKPIEVRFIVEDRSFFQEFVDVLRQRELFSTSKHAKKPKAPERWVVGFDRDPRSQASGMAARIGRRTSDNTKERS